MPGLATYTRRRFLRQLAGAGAVAATGLDAVLGQTPPPANPAAFRFAFLTDLHLMKEPAYRSEAGIAQCLEAVENLSPRPEFILVGGDLVNRARDLTIREAEKKYDQFLNLWHSHTSLPARWTFGNHDLVGTSNPSVSPTDPHYAKGLFKERFQLPHLFYGFDWKGWHFVVLDDIAPQPDHSYIGRLFEDEFAFLKTDLDAHRAMPTIVCTHIPTMSDLPLGLYFAHAAANQKYPTPANLVCTNAQRLFDDFPGHNVRAVLSGHLHHLEKFDAQGVHFVTSGAVCGNYWKGSVLGCPEGFGVVDLGADGSVAFDYRTYGWKAVST
jgi:predicted MPP superfamily phosphohydrolase